MMDGQTATAHLSHDVRFNLKAFFILDLKILFLTLLVKLSIFHYV